MHQHSESGGPAHVSGWPSSFADSHRLPDFPALADRVLGRVLQMQARVRPDAPALEFQGRGDRWTYADLHRDACGIAGGLRDLGVQPGQRIALMLPNRPEFVQAWWGSIYRGSVDAAFNPGLASDTLQQQLVLIEAACVVCDAAAYRAVAAVADQVPTLQAIVCVDAVEPLVHAARLLPFASLADAAPAEPHDARPRDAVSIRFTSGTTGLPKAVVLSHALSVARLVLYNWLMGSTSADRLYTPFPLYHVLAGFLGVMAMHHAGGCCIVDERFSARNYWPHLAEADATLGHILAPMIPMLLAQPPQAADRGHRCRRLWGAPANVPFQERFGVALARHYGMTEALVLSYLVPGEPDKPGCFGKVNPLFEVLVVDEEGQPVPDGAPGELLWRPKVPHIMMNGYLGSAGSDSLADLWFRTGDRVAIDADGYLYLHGRMGDQIRRKGVNIPALPLEQAASKVAGVLAAAAVAVPSAVGESEVKLCLAVDPRSPPSPRSVRDLLRAELPREWVPRYLELREDLPRTPTLKVIKEQLRAEGIGPNVIDLASLDEQRAPATAT